MKVEYAILGGGLAGLAAAIRLTEQGKMPLIIEANSYPTHKVCGEFLSPTGVKILNRWDIHPLPMRQMHLQTPTREVTFVFPALAGSLSHLVIDPTLAKRAVQQGATLLTETKVEDLTPAPDQHSSHTLLLSTGETVYAEHLLIASGRYPQRQVTPFIPRYMGFKAHFAHLKLNSQQLEMFLFPGGYLGVVPIEEGKANLACLVRLENVQKGLSPQLFMQNLIESQPRLKALLNSGECLFEQWMHTPVPEFGFKKTPNWPKTYFIGDASHTIPPASGNGLSLALTSGYLAAEYVLQKDWKGFKQMWHKHCRFQIYFAKFLHRLFLRPFWSNQAFWLVEHYPFIAQYAFRLTRDLDLALD